MRRLRFTPFDPFGRAEVRRVERDLIDEYRRVVGVLLEVLSTDTHSVCVEVASLPDLIRGYESVKLASVARYRERLEELWEQLPHEAGSEAGREVLVGG